MRVGASIPMSDPKLTNLSSIRRKDVLAVLEAMAMALNQEENERVLADRPDLFVTWDELPDRDTDKFRRMARAAWEALTYFAG